MILMDYYNVLIFQIGDYYVQKYQLFGCFKWN